MTALLLLQAITLCAQETSSTNSFKAPGTFSLGTRNTFSLFSHDHAIGKGIGGQLRLQFTDHLGSEWFLDYISSKNSSLTFRNDYHIGWSLMYYPGKHVQFDRLLQPYILAGHCFDYSKVIEQNNSSNYADRWSMAAQAGLGTHINITPKFDCSLSAQYMLHFGKDIQTVQENSKLVIEKENFSTPDGHLLVSVSFNYKLAHLW